MKKIFYTLAVSVMMSSFVSCSGAKTENGAETSDGTIVWAETEAPAAGITSEQASALVSSGLLTETDFEKPVFIDFNATWCGPCRQFAPFFEASAEKYGKDAKFLSVDVDVYGEVANAFGVQSIPTVIVIPVKGTPTTYVGTGEIIGEGVFDAIVEKVVK